MIAEENPMQALLATCQQMVQSCWKAKQHGQCQYQVHSSEQALPVALDESICMLTRSGGP